MLEDPPEYPLANVWRRMRVGELVYLYLLQGRAKLQAYKAVKCIRWDGAWCRKDISDKARDYV